MKRLIQACLAAGALALAATAGAQGFPQRPLKIVSPFPAGSGPDVVARLLADKMAKPLGQQVVVEARPGANGFIAIEAVKRSAPDGHELLVVDNGHVTINPTLFKKLPYDVDKDFAPVGMVFRTPFFVAVSASGPYKTVGELIAAAKATPGKLSYGTPFVGSPSHLGSAMLESMTGTQMIHVPFKETSQLFNAVGTGEVSWSLGTLATTGPMVRAGRVKLIAIAAPARLPTHADIPTVGESGGPQGFDVNAWVGVLAPRGVPADTLAVLNRELNRALADPEVRERFANIGFQPIPTSPGEFADVLRADTQKYGELVRRTGATVD